MSGIEQQWLLYGGIALAALLIVWWLATRSAKRNRTRSFRPDVLDEGVGPAARNQALIDAAPAAQVIMPPPMGDALGGMGEIVAVAASEEVTEAEPEAVAPTRPPPPPAPEPVTEQEPETEVLPEPAPMPGLDEPASPQRTETEQQIPDAEAAAVRAAEPESEPAPAAPSPAPSVATSTGDDLSRIKGLGPKLQSLLPTLGLSTYAQIASLTDADLAALDPRLGPFAGRPARDGWVEQAKYLAAGDVAGFEARFGKV